jgi:hypothetical protein
MMNLKASSAFVCFLLTALAGCGGGQADTAKAPSGLNAVSQTVQASQGGMHGGGAELAATSMAPSIRGYLSNYTVVQASGVVTVTSRINPADVQVFHDIKLLKFVDQYVSFDVDGPAGQVYRLYQAAFNRKPDSVGLGFWVHAAETGTTLMSIAGSFIASEEFTSMYGKDVAAESFVNSMYQNVLHRAGDTDGFNWWTAAVSGGADRRGVLLGFSDSAENKANLLRDMANGFAYDPYQMGGPIVPKASSYENKQAAFQASGAQTLPQDAGDASAYADFYQDGSLSMVTNTLEYNPNNVNTKDQFGHIKFYQKVNGAWVENTRKLLTDNVGCLHPRKALVADFNGDGKPDVFFACHGFDAPPFPGEKQIYLLSQADGTYKKAATTFDCFCHGASAADLNNRGYADVLLTDQTVARTPYFLINNKDGTFKPDFTRLPAGFDNKLIWTAELIDTGSGKYDAFLAGLDARGDDYTITPTIFRNDGHNLFTSSATTIAMVNSAVANGSWGTTLDVVYDKGNLYLLRTFDYKAMAIQKTNLATGASKEIYVHDGAYANGAPWFPWFFIKNGQLGATRTDVGLLVND